MPKQALQLQLQTKAKLTSKDLETIARYIKREFKLKVPVKVELAKPKKPAEIIISSPSKLSAKEVKEILQYLQEKHQIKAPVKTKIDKKILGGVRINYQDLEIDLTLNNQIWHLLDTMQTKEG